MEVNARALFSQFCGRAYSAHVDMILVGNDTPDYETPAGVRLIAISRQTLSFGFFPTNIVLRLRSLGNFIVLLLFVYDLRNLASFRETYFDFCILGHDWS